MACTITDLIVKFDHNNSPQPVVFASVFAAPATVPVFISASSTFREGAMYLPRTVATDSAGSYTFVLPWPSEQDPTFTKWIITLPDNSQWIGQLPEGVSGPLTIHDLKQTYGWGLVSTGPKNNVPFAIQGPPGSQGLILWRQGVQSWTQILSKIQATVAQQGEAIVYLDDASSGLPFVIDQSANLDNVHLIGLASYAQQQVVFGPAFSLLGTRLYLENIYAITQSTIWTYDSARPTRTIDWRLKMSAFVIAAHAPAAAVLGGNNTVVLEQTGEFNGDYDNGGSVFSLLQGSELNIWNYSQSYLDGLVVGLALGATHAIFFYARDATCLDNFAGIPVPSGISVFDDLTGDARLLPIVPAAGHFAGPQPATTTEAIDRMAALLKTLNGGTLIP